MVRRALNASPIGVLSSYLGLLLVALDLAALDFTVTSVGDKYLRLGLTGRVVFVDFPDQLAQGTIQTFVNVERVRVIQTTNTEDKLVLIVDQAVTVLVDIDHKSISDVTERRLAATLAAVLSTQLHLFHAATLR